jgi:hypothetical protein
LLTCVNGFGIKIDLAMLTRCNQNLTDEDNCLISPLNYITITTNIYMKLSMHINVCIPVTIKHVKNVFAFPSYSVLSYFCIFYISFNLFLLLDT